MQAAQLESAEPTSKKGFANNSRIAAYENGEARDLDDDDDNLLTTVNGVLESFMSASTASR
jgi:hypothetical protein